VFISNASSDINNKKSSHKSENIEQLQRDIFRPVKASSFRVLCMAYVHLYKLPNTEICVVNYKLVITPCFVVIAQS